MRAYSVTIHSVPLHSTPLLSTPRLQSPIASGARVVFGDLGVAARPLDIFTNYSKIGRVTRPVAIMHGTNDQVVPLGNGEALYNSLQSAHEVEHVGRWWADGGVRRCRCHWGATPAAAATKLPLSRTHTTPTTTNATQPLWLRGYGHNNMPLPQCNTYVAKFVEKLTEELEARKDLPQDAAEKEGCSVM